MLYNNIEFKAMQSSLDALWMKQRVISDNIANYETPGYKAKTVTFQNALSDAVRSEGGKGKYHFQATVDADSDTASRPDGNNVNMEKETIELWKTYAQYSYLSQKMTGQFKNIRYVINQAMK